MPRNRRPVDRDEKRAEIVLAAAELFSGRGYDETSMSAIAARAGVTANTVYWYVADKDALLVAVLDHILDTTLEEWTTLADRSWTDQLVWVLGRLETHHRLVSVVHSRSALSPVVDEWHERFHAVIDAIVADTLRTMGAPEADVAAMTSIGVHVVEGLLMHPRTDEEKRETLDLLIRLATAPRAGA